MTGLNFIAQRFQIDDGVAQNYNAELRREDVEALASQVRTAIQVAQAAAVQLGNLGPPA